MSARGLGGLVKVPEACRSAKQTLREDVQVAAPSRAIVAVVIDVPEVRDVVFLEVAVDALRKVDEAVLVAGREVEELQLRAGGGRIRHELRGGLGVGGGGERAEPGEGIEVREAE